MTQERKDTDTRYQWDLSAVVATSADFDACLEEVNTLLDTMRGYHGKLNAENALDILLLQSEISKIFEKLYVFAHLKSDEDTREAVALARASKMDMLGVNISEACSFIMPLLARLSAEELLALENTAGAEPFDRSLRMLIEDKPHILSQKEEKILAELGSFSADFKNIFMMFDNADIQFDNIKMPNGEEQEVSQGSYSLLLQNTDREVRKRAFLSVYKTYGAHINTLAAVYYGLVKKNVFFAKTRKYGSALEKALWSERIPVAVYDKLVAAVREGTKTVHSYMDFRKTVFGGELNMYDLYLPLAAGDNISLDYEEAFQTVKEGLAPLGEQYAQLLDTAHDGGWIDVFENKGKRSGAYSWGEYSSHPYVLLNHQKTPHDVFTIAHELGHAMHSYFANGAQCYEKAGYEIFVAEVASTVNEVLLLKHLLKTATGETRKFLLAYYLDMFRTTLFRQTMFAEFERFAHETVEHGEPLTAELLNAKYLELNQAYYGKSVTHNPEIALEWARIPHFYTAFYVYKYATGLTSAVTIASKILRDGAPYVERYKNMLKAGGSLHPLDILRLADVDLETSAPYDTMLQEFSATFAELKELY